MNGVRYACSVLRKFVFPPVKDSFQYSNLFKIYFRIKSNPNFKKPLSIKFIPKKEYDKLAEKNSIRRADEIVQKRLGY